MVPRLLLITEPCEDLLDRVEQAVAGGVGHVLLRAKGEAAQSLTATALALKTLLQPTGGQLLIHDRVDVALAVEAQGVQLPSNGLPTPLARRLLGGGRLLGRSCHTPQEAKQAFLDGADYVTLSPLFPTLSHPDAQGLGVEIFSQWRREITGPVLALGGIHPQNCALALQAGAFGVAIIRGILQADNPASASREILDQIYAHMEQFS
ncbi:MAG: thiamine phosphate synthase [Magnetococcales bacterium]|nr:thiamine phosphate synthase [Magnetococcales bacterium]NGZ28279.1 thiamine phosphate synthase [Magnetococcales bacterium]